MAEPREWTIGKYLLRFEEPDVLRLKAGSTCSLEDAQRMLALIGELSAARPLILITEVGGARLDMEVRAALARGMRPEWVRCFINVGASFVQRALIKAMALAAWMNTHAPREVHFTDTVEQAQELAAHIRLTPRARP